VLIEVVTYDGSPVESAKIWLIESSQPLIKTANVSANGYAKFFSESNSFHIGVKSSEMGTALLAFERDVQREPVFTARVVLPRLQVLRGRVLDPSGLAVADATVLGMSSLTAITPDRLSALMKVGCDAYPMAKTSATGDFELSVPADQTRIALVPGKIGYLGPTVWRWTHSAEQLSLTVFPVYAAILRFQVPEQLESQVDWNVFSQGGIDLDIRLDGQVRQPYIPISLLLAGLPTSCSGLRSWPYRAIVSMSTNSELSNGELEVSGGFPGFSDFRATVPLTRISDKSPIHDILLEPNTDKRGTIEIEFEHYVADAHAWDSNRYGWGSIHLRHSSGALYQAPIWEIGNDPLVLRGLPIGEYSCTASSSCSPWIGNPINVIVSQGQTSKVAFDCSTLATVEVQFETLLGLPHQGYALLRIMKSDNKFGDPEEIHYECSPYFLELLPAGIYDLDVLVPGYAKATVTGHVVAPGSNLPITVMLQEIHE